jgi:hypothetical protein
MEDRFRELSQVADRRLGTLIMDSSPLSLMSSAMSSAIEIAKSAKAGKRTKTLANIRSR